MFPSYLYTAHIILVLFIWTVTPVRCHLHVQDEVKRSYLVTNKNIFPHIQVHDSTKSFWSNSHLKSFIRSSSLRVYFRQSLQIHFPFGARLSFMHTIWYH